jgi:hypothetical protein
VLSLRTVARLIKWADRSDSPSGLAAFFNMVDRRKTLHRQACEWSAAHAEIFLRGQIPYASIVEQMAIRRMPLPVFAPRDSATTAFAGIWAELQTLLQQGAESAGQRQRWGRMLHAIESLIARLESVDRQAPTASGQAPAVDAEVYFVHRFDTDGRDLERTGHVLELGESKGSLLIVAARSGGDAGRDLDRRAQAQIDRSWAWQILSGEMSPLAALEQRLGRPRPPMVETLSAMVGGRKLRRIGTRVDECFLDSRM